MKTTKDKKPKSIVRTEALMLIAFVVTLLLIYFTLFFELHLKWMAQKTLTKVYGAEVNIAKLSLTLKPVALKLNNMQFTNHQDPAYNLFEIGELSFKLNTDDLLFASFTTEEALVKGVRVNRKRSHPGYVSPETQKLVSLSLDLKKNKKAVIENKTKGNILDNIASFSKTNDLKSELKKFSDSFELGELEAKYKDRLKSQKEVLAKIEDVAKQDQFKPIEDQLKNLELKIKAKAEPIEIISLGKTLLDDIKAKKDEVKDLKNEFKSQGADLKNIKNDLDQDLDLKKQELKSRFDIPDISPEALAQDFFAETITTRFYLFNYWMDQIRKNSEQKVQNVKSKVLTESQSKMVKDKIAGAIEASKKEKAIKAEIEATRQSQSQIIHFGKNLRPKFWIKKTLIQAEAKESQDLQNFTGRILNIASDQKLIGKPIEVYFKGDLPKDKIFNINLEAKLNHHLPQINETFKVAANYPISSFKIIDDGSLKLFLNKATSRSEIDGSIIDKQIKNMSIKNNLDQADFLFNSTKGDIQQILEPIFANINSFDIDIFLKGALDNPDLKILSTLTEKISAGLKAKVASQLGEFNAELAKSRSTSSTDRAPSPRNGFGSTLELQQLLTVSQTVF